MRTIMVTGGAGFIGSAVCRELIGKGHRVVNLDKLTYAGNLQSLKSVSEHPDYQFIHADIADRAAVAAALRQHDVNAVMHLAAESHVDRSIDGPAAFIETNILGTFALLEVCLDYWRALDSERKQGFRFHHVSTDEVFGDLPFDESRFSETTAYAPSSPYSASKAASDHLVHAWYRTFGLPVLLSNCSNNYGPCQFPEKLIPLVLLNSMEGRELPVYGTGINIRDWLHVEDHARALRDVLTKGQPGETYAVGGGAERSNLAVVHAICDAVDARVPVAGGGSRRDLIRFVSDRPGHDRRYAIDATKIRETLGWAPAWSFEAGLADTIDWYLANSWWWQPLRTSHYDGARLGSG